MAKYPWQKPTPTSAKSAHKIAKAQGLVPDVAMNSTADAIHQLVSIRKEQNSYQEPRSAEKDKENMIFCNLIYEMLQQIPNAKIWLLLNTTGTTKVRLMEK